MIQEKATRLSSKVQQFRVVKRKESFSGRLIAKLSARKYEAEVLFPIDSTFKALLYSTASSPSVMVQLGRGNLRISCYGGSCRGHRGIAAKHE